MADGDGTADGDLIELQLPPQPSVVAVARMVIGAVAATEPMFDEERTADLRLAVSEACTNAIQAQLANYEGSDPSAPIVLRCTVHGSRIDLSVQDHAGGFDPDGIEAHPPVADPMRLDHEGGLGIPLIRLLADECAFVPSPGGTTVHMAFGPHMPVSPPII